MPKVSIIIPVYKVEKYLPDCLDSVLAQTFTDWEAICINDASPDRCGEILDEYARKDKRFKIITQENQGEPTVRNAGLKQASGEYLCFLDSDDMLHPVFLERMYHQISQNHSDIISCDFQKTPFTKDIPQKTKPQIYQNVFDRFLCKKPKIIASVWGKLFKKETVISLFFPNAKVGSDLVYLYEALYLAKQAIYLPEKLYFYRKRENSVTTSNFSEKNIIGNIQTATYWHDYFKDKELKPKTRHLLNKKIARQIFKPAVLDPKRLDPENADKWYALSRPALIELKQAGIFYPQHLPIVNRIKSYFFLKGSNNA